MADPADPQIWVLTAVGLGTPVNNAVVVGAFCKNAEEAQFRVKDLDLGVTEPWPSTWSAYAPETQVSLSGNGPWVVYGRFKSAEGGISSEVEAPVGLPAADDEQLDLFDSNIKRSLHEFIYTHFQMPYDYPVNYEDARFDPEGAERYVEIKWLSFGNMPWTTNVLHIRCFGRVVDDSLRVRFEEMVGRLKRVLNVTAIPFKDYTNDPENPVQLSWRGEDLEMPIRYQDRPTAETPSGVGNANEANRPSVDMTVLTYHVYCPRPSVVP